MSVDSLRHWEQAEIARSQAEASHTPIDSLYVAQRERRRYFNPPSDTPFPLEYVYHLVGDVAGKLVLDLGCGKGGNSLLAVIHGERVVGVDDSKAALDLAHERFRMNQVAGPVLFVAGSAHTVALPDESVDLVLGMGILHHLDLTLASREVNRV